MGEGYGDSAKIVSARLGGSGIGSAPTRLNESERMGTAGLCAHLSGLLEQVEMKHAEITNAIEPALRAAGPEPACPSTARPGVQPSPLNGALEVLAERLINLAERQTDVLRRLSL